MAAGSIALVVLLASLQPDAAGADAGAADAGPAPEGMAPPPPVLSPVPTPAPAAVPPTALPPPPPPPDAEAESFFHFETLVQVRDQQTWVYIKPALESRVRLESGAAADETLRLIRDTARAHDGLQLRWASLTFWAQPKPYLRAGMQIDFARLLDSEDLGRLIWEAPVVLSLAPWIDIAAGVLHVPFSVIELLEEQLSLARRNTGVRVDVSPLQDHGRLQLTAGAFQGATTGATGAQDFRGPGLLAGRVLAQPVPHVRLGTSVAWRPRATLEWWDELRYRFVAFESGLAVAANVTVGLPRFLFRGEWMMGSRTDTDVPVPLQYRRGDARNFMAAWAMAVVRFPVRGMVLMPALRMEWLDQDTRFGFDARNAASPATGRVLQLSAGINLDFDAHTRLLLDVTIHDVEPGTRNGDYHEIVRYDTDWTSVTLQLQVRV